MSELEDARKEVASLRAVIAALNDLLFSKTGMELDQVSKVLADNDRWRTAFQDLVKRFEAGDYRLSSGFCSYCDERWPKLDGETVEVARAHARDHAAVCPQHPVRAVEQRVDVAVERLLFMMHIYRGYAVDSRGPAGCVYDALKALAPGVMAEVVDGFDDYSHAYAKYFDSDTQQPKRAIK